jgi:small-conductance mechanosensitive channel
MNSFPSIETSGAWPSPNRPSCSRRCRSWSGLIFVLALLAAPTLRPPAARAQQPESKAAGSTAGEAATPSGETEEVNPAAAPVLVGGEPAIWIVAGIGPYTPEFRAERISDRIRAIIRDRSTQDLKISIVEAGNSTELRIGQRLVMNVTRSDSATVGIPRVRIAQAYARDLENAIRAERLRYEPATLVRSSVYALLSTLALVGLLWLIGRFTRQLRSRLLRSHWLDSLRLQKLQIVTADRLMRTLGQFLLIFRVAVIILVLDIYLTYVLGLFPWTRAASLQLFDYLLAPLRVAGTAFLGYLPKLLFVLFITLVIYLAIRLVAVLFSAIQTGRLVFPEFPPEWADPTNKIVRLLLIAFGVVVAFPYLPASGSPAFTGVSVFMGVLISLASSSALSNMIAGLVLTYTGAFRLGDRVQIGDTYGDILKTSMLATRVRTIKNEEVTIPNSIVLNSSVVNFSRKGKTPGLILHTSVTIGYDAPWRKIHELLVRAATETEGILSEPKPFVWQTALNDFYVTYEINAYTDKPQEINDIYAVMHAKIQDSFFEAGVEIMSPHYTSLRDGNTVAIPEQFRGPGYRPHGFQVESRLSKPEDSPQGR